MKKSTITTSTGEPFGLRMGMSAGDIGTELEPLGAPFVFRPLRVPRPHPAFDLYGVKIAPRCGLAWVKAVGRNIATDPSGAQLRSAFAALEAELAAVYGTNERRDGPADGHDSCAPGDWMAALHAEEQVLAAQWSEYSGSSLSGGLTSVLLVAEASKATSGYVIVQCTFQNLEEANAEIASWRIRAR